MTSNNGARELTVDTIADYALRTQGWHLSQWQRDLVKRLITWTPNHTYLDFASPRYSEARRVRQLVISAAQNA